jgi:hypothetical protein
MSGHEPWVARSRDDLLAGARARVVVDPADGKSGSTFERVTIDDASFFAKTFSYRTDWIMRVAHDHDLRTLKVWRAGIMDQAPPEIDHTVVGMAVDGAGDDAQLTILMRDVGRYLFAEGDETISLEAHLGLIDAMAALSARFWEWKDDLGLTTLEERLRLFAPQNIAVEAAGPDPPIPVQVAARGWPRLTQCAPSLAEVLSAIHDAPGPLADAIRSTPATFVHGDWKLGNLGRYPDGRAILLDWAFPGSGPPLWDLAWYLALNCARLPIDKQTTIDAFRSALERRGVSTAAWFELQLDLCLLGVAATFGWEKAVGDEDELRWWERRALLGVRHVADAYPTPRR